MAFSSSFLTPTTFNTNNRRFSPFSPKIKTSKTVTVSAIPPFTTASAADLSSFDGTALAVIGGGSVAALAAALSLTDPERRRRMQAEEVGGGDKEVVREYFNSTGFQRWKKIYGETDDVNKVQRDIRLGHSKTVENVLKMLKDEGSLKGVTVCDAGCGTGSLSIPLAKEGAIVLASDISAAMVSEAEKNAKEQLGENVLPKFEVKDLESLDGKYDTVVCLDVLIHYPQTKADGMIAHLASLAENRLILSFAPKTFYYNLLKRVGELFPGPSKATRAYLHAEADVERALKKVGWRIRNRGLITTQFYFARLVEAVPA
ncbi:magnesium protoporphyrin IX methyltransferase, chloroplastic [Ricinus communis]|uniref:magnesium protoporphyrin IX methyltransferase, chloroplastic n=1 Tax=Ricinus communis TaxID=3988 RepID=UPI00201A9B91|nr:magnesium protoporphyrin IX methyltransferase, chloroplastic [Ricinus communis]